MLLSSPKSESEDLRFCGLCAYQLFTFDIGDFIIIILHFTLFRPFSHSKGPSFNNHGTMGLPTY